MRNREAPGQMPGGLSQQYGWKQSDHTISGVIAVGHFDVNFRISAQFVPEQFYSASSAGCHEVGILAQRISHAVVNHIASCKDSADNYGLTNFKHVTVGDRGAVRFSEREIYSIRQVGGRCITERLIHKI